MGLKTLWDAGDQNQIGHNKQGDYPSHCNIALVSLYFKIIIFYPPSSNILIQELGCCEIENTLDTFSIVIRDLFFIDKA